jgi:hypothetical protein
MESRVAESQRRRRRARIQPVTTDSDNIRVRLAALGLSQRGAARELELDERTVRRYCTGEIDVPRAVWLALDALDAKLAAIDRPS